MTTVNTTPTSRKVNAKIIPIKFEAAMRNKRALRSLEQVPDDSIPILEMFETFEGEGMQIGLPRLFIRVGICAVGCKSCDTVHSWYLKGSNIMNIDEILASSIELGKNVRDVTITGGEPAHYPRQLKQLVPRLRKLGFKVNMETSGMILDSTVFECFDHVSLDIKTPSSGVPMEQDNINALKDTLKRYKHLCQVKAVIFDDADLEYIDRYFKDILTHESFLPLILTPCADNTKGEVPLAEYNRILEMIAKWNRKYNIRVIAQAHKLLSFR